MKQVRSPLSTLLKVVLCTISLSNTAFSSIAEVTSKLGELSTKLTTLQGNLTTLKDSLADLNNAIPTPPEDVIGENEVLITLVYGDILKQQFDFKGDMEHAAIVNAANNGMTGGGGIDGAITTRGGTGLAAERFAVPGGPDMRCTTGEARLTNGYGINEDDCKTTFIPTKDKIKIIHTAGPTVTGLVSQTEQDLLKNCYTNCLREADKRTLRANNEFIQSLGSLDLVEQPEREDDADAPKENVLGKLSAPITTVAFCSISTGIFKYDIVNACPVALQAVCNYFNTHPESTIREVRFVTYVPWKNKYSTEPKKDYETYKLNLEQLCATNPAAFKVHTNATVLARLKGSSSVLLNSNFQSINPAIELPPLVFTLTKGAAPTE